LWIMRARKAMPRRSEERRRTTGLLIRRP
jgi:hypothetical protein